VNAGLACTIIIGAAV